MRLQQSIIKCLNIKYELDNDNKIELLNKEKHYINTIECVNIYNKLIN